MDIRVSEMLLLGLGTCAIIGCAMLWVPSGLGTHPQHSQESSWEGGAVGPGLQA